MNIQAMHEALDNKSTFGAETAPTRTPLTEAQIAELKHKTNMVRLKFYGGMTAVAVGVGYGASKLGHLSVGKGVAIGAGTFVAIIGALAYSWYRT